MSEIKRGCVLSVGGVKGGYQVGVLDMLSQKHQTEYSFFSGISAGAINAFILAQYPTLREGLSKLLDVWAKLESKNVYEQFQFWPPNKTWLGVSRILIQDGLHDTTPLLKMLQEHYDETRFKSSGKILRLGVTEKTTGEYFEVTEKTKNLPFWVLASASFPIAFKSVIGKNGIYSDGGHVHMTPLSSAIEAGCTDIDILLTAPFHMKPVKKEDIENSTFYSGLRTIDIMTCAIWRSELKLCHHINQRVELGDPSYRKVNVTVYAPEEPLVADSFKSLDFNPVLIQSLIEKGRHAVGLPLAEFLAKAKEKRLIQQSL
jgi:predicted acylesterase/phospholipase RssA